MRTIIILMLLLLAVSCGKGGGGSSSSGTPAGNNGILDFSDRADSTYELRVSGCANSTFTAIAFANPGTADEVRHDWNGFIDGSGTQALFGIPGKAMEWEVTSVSGGCQLNMQLTRNTGGASFVATDIILSNGQTGFIQDY